MIMLILSVDSSASPASVCLFENGKILSEYYINVGLTHSQTLVAMIESMLKITGKSIDDVDLYAVNNGPGSFTGVRIGVSAVKGMAYAQNKPCVAVSTLRSMAQNLFAQDAVICACMDARRHQVYNALFHVCGDKVEQIAEDRAIAIDELKEQLSLINQQVILVGDGSELVYNSCMELNNVCLAPENHRFQNASSVAMIAAEKAKAGDTLPAAALMPSYLRLSQAERERLEKQKG